ncbi:ribosomal-processing cysteine protease Prp [Paenibacillus gansuensis]|uniref:Ribosomal processing cysteine protease Prp n=1 Tax=Paenibacillus gansuensis TaxID=306542 RepID=A0ABW5PBJ5_9BACL
MIRVLIRRRQEDRSISGYTVTGHALYADPGKDIVCAGVSAVAVGTVNSIEALASEGLETEMEDGFLRVEVPLLEGDAQERAQLLLESMVVMLKTIKESYGKYISIQESYNKGGRP